MINYIIQIIFFQVVFLAVYDLFLKKETFFKWNRFYLLVTPILSFVIPFLKIDSFKTATTQEYVVLLPEVVLNPQTVFIQSENSSETLSFLTMLTYIGIVAFSIVFLYKLIKILRLIIKNKISVKENYKLVLLENEQTAFSFFNYIFVGKKLYQQQELQIIQHELVHSRQYHTLDLLFFEFLKIIMWFNPMVYLYQKRITLLHEYISDAEVVKQTDKKQYFNNLLKETFDIENISFINQFYKHSLIKKRIIMITKAKSKSVKQLKYLLLVPILGSMLFYISCTDEVQTDNIDDATLNSVQFELSEDKKSGYIKTTKGTYFYKKNEDGSIKFYNKFGEAIDIGEIADSDISFSKDGKEINVNAKGGIISGSQILDDIPFFHIDQAPEFPGCTGSQEEMKKCFNTKMRQHVSDNFNAKVADDLSIKGKQKIYIKFRILKSGDVEIEGVRAAHKSLENEARRVVNKLPKLIPGEYGGKKVNVAYMLPIIFDVK